MERRTPAAVLFDLDDTLTDRAASLHHFAEGFLARYRPALAPTIADETVIHAIVAADEVGYSPRESWARQVAQTLPWRTVAPDIAELVALWSKQFPACAVAREGALSTLAILHARGYRLGVITNGGTLAQRAKLDALRLNPLLDVAVISEEVGMEKPDPAIFALALERLAVAPARAWFIGDHPINDVEGARAAGLDAIWLEAQLPWPESLARPAYRIWSMADVLALTPPLM